MKSFYKILAIILCMLMSFATLTACNFSGNINFGGGNNNQNDNYEVTEQQFENAFNSELTAPFNLTLSIETVYGQQTSEQNITIISKDNLYKLVVDNSGVTDEISFLNGVCYLEEVTSSNVYGYIKVNGVWLREKIETQEVQEFYAVIAELSPKSIARECSINQEIQFSDFEFNQELACYEIVEQEDGVNLYFRVYFKNAKITKIEGFTGVEGSYSTTVNVVYAYDNISITLPSVSDDNNNTNNDNNNDAPDEKPDDNDDIGGNNNNNNNSGNVDDDTDDEDDGTNDDNGGNTDIEQPDDKPNEDNSGDNDDIGGDNGNGDNTDDGSNDDGTNDDNGGNDNTGTGDDSTEDDDVVEGTDVVIQNGVTYSLLESGCYEVTAFDGSVTEVTILDQINDIPVTEIADGAFRAKKKITKVTLPESIVRIGDSAFKDCIKLIEINLENVEIIGANAFENAFADKRVVINLSSLEEIGLKAFLNCPKLGVVDFGNAPVVEIPKQCFASCSLLYTVTLSSNTTHLEESAFDSCNLLTNINLDKVEYIKLNAFRGCVSITEAQLDSIIEIGDYAFLNCNALARVVIGENAGRIYLGAFRTLYALTYFEIKTASTKDWRYYFVNAYEDRPDKLHADGWNGEDVLSDPAACAKWITIRKNNYVWICTSEWSDAMGIVPGKTYPKGQIWS